jgi:hypothetical protein
VGVAISVSTFRFGRTGLNFFLLSDNLKLLLYRIGLFLLPQCGKLMVVEYKKRNLTNTVKMQGYRNGTIIYQTSDL